MTPEEWVAEHLADAPDLSRETLDMVLDLCDLVRAPLEPRPATGTSWGLAS